MRVALICDTHFGARSDSRHFERNFKRFFEKIFFKRIAEEGIREIIHLGDLVDRKSSINYQTLSNTRSYFFDPLKDLGVHLRAMVGNHDCHYKSTTRVNAVRELLAGSGATVYEQPEETFVGEVPTLFLPWTTEDTVEKRNAMIAASTSRMAMGHLDLVGFEMYRGRESTCGQDASLYDKFDLVASGHYHCKSSRGTVHYLGAPYELTWSDCGEPHGFHILDTDGLRLEFVENPFRIHSKIFYKPGLSVSGDFLDKVVRVVVEERGDEADVQRVASSIESAGAAVIQVVDSNPAVEVLADENTLAETENATSLIRRSVARLDGVSDDEKADLEELMLTLYSEAQRGE